MRLEISVSERDKRLLMLTGITAILTLSVRFLIYPAFERGKKLEHDIDKISAVYDERRARMNERKNLDELVARQRLALDEASKSYSKPLAGWEMDALITGLAVRHGLFPENLSLTNAAPGMVEPYIFAPSEEPSEDSTEVPIEDGGVLLANARLETSGEPAQWKAFLNDVAQNYPSLRVTHFEVSPGGGRTGEPELAGRIVFNLEIYMFKNE